MTAKTTAADAMRLKEHCLRLRFTLVSLDPSQRGASGFVRPRRLLEKLTGVTGVGSSAVLAPIQSLTPLMESKPLTAQTASKVPRLTGSNAASNAPQTSRENRVRLRASARIMPMLKQIAGVTITISIQNKGVADQSLLKALVA